MYNILYNNRINFPFKSLSPRVLNEKLIEVKEKYTEAVRKRYKCNKQIKKLRKRVQSLKTVIKDVNVQKSLSTYALEHLNTLISGIPFALMKRMLTQIKSGVKSTKTYPSDLKKFALTLHFYSPKAYDYVRKTFHLALPHPSVLRKWGSTVNCEPGFSQPCFSILKQKVEDADKNGKKICCSLIFDEMSIKKQIEFDGVRNWGYVDIGVDLNNDNCEAASEALVLMVVSQNSSWKLPIGYFLIKHVSAVEKSNLIIEAIKRLDVIGIFVTTVTCDGPSANFAMFNHLGCCLKTVDGMKTYFDHPLNKEQKVYAVFDICHMLKLIRNCLGDLKIIKDINGNEIKWQYVEELYKIQKMEGFHLANKLNKKHVEWRRQKMKV